MADISSISVIEKEIIGGMVLWSDCPGRVDPRLEGNLFSDARTGIIFNHLMEIYRSGGKIDGAKTMAELPEDLAAILDDCICHTSSGADIEHYSGMIVSAGSAKLLSQRLANISACLSSPRLGETYSQSFERAMWQTKDAIESAEAAMAGISEVAGVDGPTGIFQIFNASEAAAKGEVVQINTGIGMIDRLTGGVRPATTWIIGARPGAGKSVMLWQIAMHAAKAGKKAVVVSAEMSASGYWLRAIAAETGINSRKLQDGNMSSSEWLEYSRASSRASEAYGGNLRVYDDLGSGIDRIIAELSRLARVKEIDLAMIDYVQRLNCGGMIKDANRNAEIEYISRAVADFSRLTKVPVIMASQFSRSSESSRPTLSRLRDSGSLEQDADVVILLHQDIEASKDREAIIAKNRQGEVGTVKLKLDSDRLIFRETTNQTLPEGF